jgi:hypothetical protein
MESVQARGPILAIGLSDAALGFHLGSVAEEVVSVLLYLFTLEETYP